MKIRDLPSQYYDERPGQCVVDTIVVHSMYGPELSERFLAERCKACLDQYQVSAHYIVDRTGQIWQMVSEDCRAWHAGESQMPFDDDKRKGVNAFSIGIELLCSDTDPTSTEQYHALTTLILDIAERHPIYNIVGHSDIAPGRKEDPLGFSWTTLAAQLKKIGNLSKFRFPLATAL